MSDDFQDVNALQKNENITLTELRSEQENLIFLSMKNYSLEWAFNHYLNTIQNNNTRKNYQIGFYQLYKHQVIDIYMSLQTFTLKNPNNILDQIKLINSWSEATRQTRAAMFIAFTKFLQRTTESVTRKATPIKTGTNKGFLQEPPIKFPRLL